MKLIPRAVGGNTTTSPTRSGSSCDHNTTSAGANRCGAVKSRS
ncbi:hypothetical protein OV079_46295 [Nannocystis pusilla]|uniref:Uncharacterized protein n=1 Tax=Nannocystis pusilla TaxID=889268 RepID=A0A9X3F6Z2_9BACT|nr:hypothetical protein [Nannocystis pusilla]MCY1012828.1 hypothetical protein [Nannocystis pusilla]